MTAGSNKGPNRVLLVETLIERRMSPLIDGFRPLRPLPIWCPLPRGGRDPKISVAGWLAGHQRIVKGELVITASWAAIRGDRPEQFVSDPSRAIEPQEAFSSEGTLWSVSGTEPTLDHLTGILFSRLHQMEGLDLCSINEARSDFAGDLTSSPKGPPPARGRGALILTHGVDAQLETEATEVGAGPYLLTTLHGQMPGEEQMRAVDRLSRQTVSDWLAKYGDELERFSRRGGNGDSVVSQVAKDFSTGVTG